MKATLTASRHPATVRTSMSGKNLLKAVAPRRLIVPIACVLALVTGAWIGQAYALFMPIEQMGEIAPSAGNAEGTAWRFYDAIDRFFRSGDDADVREILSPNFVDHGGATGAGVDREGFLSYLTDLRTNYPALRLTPEEVIAQHDRAVVRIAIDGDEGGAIMGIPLSGRAPWPQFDFVRVEHGQVVERWGGDAGYGSADLLLAEEMTISVPGKKVPRLRRVTFAPGGDDSALDRMLPAVVLVGLGRLEAETAGGNGTSTPATDRVLGPGSTLLITDRGDIRLYNRTDAPAVVLLLSLGHATGPATSPVAGRVVVPDSGITEQELASPGELPIPNPGDRVIAELGRITLSPGTHIAPHATDGAEMCVIEDGVLTMTADGASTKAWLRDPAGRSVFLGQYAAIGPGHGLSVARAPGAEGESRISYRNDSDHPVTFLFLRFRTE